jgi:hypothetical protein
MPALAQPTRRAFPPLSIGHLLLLVLTCSVPLAILIPHGDQAWKNASELYRISKLAAIFFTVVDVLRIGIKFFGFAVLIRERSRSASPTLSPGHWYFYFAGPVALFYLLSHSVPSWVHIRWPVTENVLHAILHLIAAMVAGRAVIAIPSWPWRVCLELKTAWLLALSLLFAYRAGTRFAYLLDARFLAILGSLNLAVCLAALAAVAIDLACHQRRDWLHYFAVIAIVLDLL